MFSSTPSSCTDEENIFPFDSSKTTKIFDPIRNKSLDCTPEEKVRQNLLSLLVHKLHYPEKLIIVEKELRTLLPLFTRKDAHLPKRRPDLLIVTPQIYTNCKGDTYKFGNPRPLLLIECKARIINQNTLIQLLSYNYILGTCCLAIVSRDKQLTGFINPRTQTLNFYSGLPEYTQLLNYYCSLNSNYPKL
ncbi:type I restriction enzyme HsdR N-terminal domain-containing protein [Chlamydia sp. 17-3921]|uniref:type I restriction enzyme HsdR N-terminal domain-containing protein n=1 Tax=Chlamydia sp. 17-3921 TaxID=2675798 RepID=UPI00191B4630|nr:type I restriction enzyme HsdR N-terminal domain-containing protein [Chlamydia sp. 17-3921]